MTARTFAMVIAVSLFGVPCFRGEVVAQSRTGGQPYSAIQFGAAQSQNARGAIGLAPNNRSFGQGQGQLGRQQNSVGGGQPFGQQNRSQNQQGFVGSDAQDAQSMYQNMSRWQRRRTMFDFAIESLNEIRESRQRRASRRRRPDPVRVQLRPTLLAAPESTEVTGAAFQERLSASLPNTLQDSTMVALDEGVATIRGVVADDYQRLLAERLVSLQPGVDRVDNRLTIESEEVAPPLDLAR